MAEQKFSKLALAEMQLEAAIGLFLTRNCRISAITLAGAADGIFHGLVLKEGKQTFSEYSRNVADVLTGKIPARAKFAKHINDTLYINHLKHMDNESSDVVQFDPDLSALGAILKAIANHSKLVEETPPYVHIMLQWAWMFYDGERIREDEPYNEPAGKKVMSWYSERSEKMKEMESRLAKLYERKSDGQA